MSSRWCLKPQAIRHLEQFVWMGDHKWWCVTLWFFRKRTPVSCNDEKKNGDDQYVYRQRHTNSLSFRWKKKNWYKQQDQRLRYNAKHCIQLHKKSFCLDICHRNSKIQKTVVAYNWKSAFIVTHAIVTCCCKWLTGYLFPVVSAHLLSLRIHCNQSFGIPEFLSDWR